MIEDKEIHQLLLGSMCGDGGIYIRHDGVTPRYSEGHSVKQRGYLLWKKSIFEKELKISFYDYKDRTKCFIDSFVSNKLVYYRDLFYINGSRKVITKEVLDMLDPLGWAVFYMDDGCYDYFHKNIIITACIYNKSVQLDIVSSLMDKYDVFASVVNKGCVNGKDAYYVSMNVKNSIKFLNIIKDFVHPSMNYKLGSLSDSNIDMIEESRLKRYNINKDYVINNRDIVLGYKRKYRKNNRDVLNLSNRVYRAKVTYGLDGCVDRESFSNSAIEKYGSIEKFKEKFPRCRMV